MKLKSFLALLLVSGSTVLFSEGCKSKPGDLELKTNVENAIANPAITVVVTEADVRLSGDVQDAAAKNAAETAAKSVKDVKNVTNAISITPASPPPPPVNIAVDSVLVKGVDALLKNYKSVNATVNNSVVTLTGSVSREQLPRIMQGIMALRPKSVDNKLTVK